ncbi:MAG: arylesterase, partial [Lentisphaeria bacterium]|nr:arylesterase [Lentisphaeria bacterium]
KIALVPFILKSVGGVRKMNQADGIHPNSLGHKKVAETIWPVLNKLLK